MKPWRQSQILEVIDQEAVTSQEELRLRLATRGIDATQATISRDLKDLGLVKRAGDGAYVRPGVERASPVVTDQLRKAVGAQVRRIERVGNLLVLRTDPGQAQGVAILIDRAQPPEVAGTVAGDDTILIVGRGEPAAIELEQRWREVLTR